MRDVFESRNSTRVAVVVLKRIQGFLGGREVIGERPIWFSEGECLYRAMVGEDEEGIIQARHVSKHQ